MRWDKKTDGCSTRTDWMANRQKIAMTKTNGDLLYPDPHMYDDIHTSTPVDALVPAGGSWGVAVESAALPAGGEGGEMGRGANGG